MGQDCAGLMEDWVHFAVNRASPAVNTVHCGPGPSGQVWYLSGNNPSANTEQLSCTVPSDAAIVFPLFLGFALACPEAYGEYDCEYSTDASMLTYVNEMISQQVAFDVALDGVPLEHPPEEYFCAGTVVDFIYDPSQNSRLTVPANSIGPGLPPEDFDCTAPWEEPNDCDVPAGPRNSAWAAYLFRIQPLTQGQYSLRYSGCRGVTDPLCVDLTWHITVVPRDEL